MQNIYALRNVEFVSRPWEMYSCIMAKNIVQVILKVPLLGMTFLYHFASTTAYIYKENTPLLLKFK